MTLSASSNTAWTAWRRQGRLSAAPTTSSTTPKTHGRWVEGTRDERVLLSSKYNPDGSIDQNYVAALALARRIGLVKDRADMASAADVELKFAMVMRRHDLKHATIVINHPKGPCVGPLG